MPATPSQIAAFLDRHVVGQEEAKRQLAVAVFTHRQKLALAAAGRIALEKSNVLLIGPTGSGKTLLCETLSKALEVPFVTGNATSLAQSQYVNEELEAILLRLIDKAGGDLARAQRGILFIDEIDKLKAGGEEGARSGGRGERVQHALLKIMEGAPVKLSSGGHFDTTETLFICGGAFVGIEAILADTHAYGYIATGSGEEQRVLDRLNARVKPTDLARYGLIPEFAGRLPIVARLQPLSKEMLVRIQTEPQNALYKQFRAIFAGLGAELVIAPQVFEEIAELAIEYQAGARALRGIFEEMLTPALYLVPDHPEIRRIEIHSLFERPRYLGASASGAPPTGTAHSASGS